MLNSGCTYSQRLPARAQGVTLLDWLCTEFRHSSREEWGARLTEGRVTLDRRAASPSEQLHRGQQLTWSRPPWDEPEVPLRFEVVYADERLLVVDKPSGLPTLPGGDFHQHTLLSLVRQRDVAWAAVHRLGRGTSGLVLFARPHAAPALHAAFRAREVIKRYRARVSGALAPQVITAPIGRVPHARMGELYAVSQRGRFAETHVERIEGELAFVRIITGRPHQIRIHLAHVGAPLKGDPLYGPGGALADARPSDLGYELHAYELGVAGHTFRSPSC